MSADSRDADSKSAGPSAANTAGRPERTHSLTEVAAEHGIDQVSKDPVRWLTMRLNRGELRGVRFGRYWRMRDSDIDYMLDRYSNAPKPVAVAPSEPTPIVDGISLRSRRLRRATR